MNYPKCFSHFMEVADDCYSCEFAEECEQETEDIERDMEDFALNNYEEVEAKHE